MKVVDPRGVPWTVRLHWRPRFEGRGLRARLAARRQRAVERRDDGEVHWYDVFDLPVLDDSLAAFVISLVAIALAVLLVVFGAPLLLAVVDLVVIIAVTLGGLVGRLCLRRPWTVEATSGAGTFERRVVGLRRARALVRTSSQDIQAGRTPSTHTSLWVSKVVTTNSEGLT